MPEPIDLDKARQAQRPPKGETPPKAPPRSSSRTKKSQTSGESKPKTRTPSDRKLAEAVAGLYQVGGSLALGIGLRLEDQGIAASGVKTVEMAEPIAEAWLDLADKNPKVKNALLKMTEVSSLGVLVGMHVTMLVPLLVDRGIVPDTIAAAMSANGNGSPANN